MQLQQFYVWAKCYINNVKKIQDCTFDYETKIFSRNSIYKCSFYCPHQCDEVSYSVSSLNTTSNITSFRVFYRSLFHTTITQTPKMQIFDLISNIGGLFSLFIGISFVTIFEIFELISIFFILLFKKQINGTNFE